MIRKRTVAHPVLGNIEISVNTRARRFIARWHGTRLLLTVPAGVTADEIHSAIERMTPGLLARRPAPTNLTPGHELRYPDFILRIEASEQPSSVGSRVESAPGAIPILILRISPGLDTSAPAVEKVIVRHLRRLATYMAPTLLIARAQAISAALGVAPAAWTIGRGSSRLGSCGTDRVISLSAMCIFLPPRLRDYVICHELAHLTHFNHSPAFHTLCSAYCGGDGNARRAELKAYRWPVPR